MPVYHDLVLKACREAGFVPNVPHEADHLPMVLGMVAAGSGISLIPAFGRMTKPPLLVVFVSLRPAALNLETAVAWRRENTFPMMSDFVEIARRVLAQARKRVVTSNIE